MRNSKSKYSNNPEQTMWLTQAKNGNSLAFNHIVEKYQHSIYNLCYRMLQNADDAEDATQEVFTRAYFKLDSYNDTDKFSTWAVFYRFTLLYRQVEETSVPIDSLG